MTINSWEPKWDSCADSASRRGFAAFIHSITDTLSPCMVSVPLEVGHVFPKGFSVVSDPQWLSLLAAPDGLSYALLRLETISPAKILTVLINKIILSGALFAYWKLASIMPIFRYSTSNILSKWFRPIIIISFASTLAKQAVPTRLCSCPAVPLDSFHFAHNVLQCTLDVVAPLWSSVSRDQTVLWNQLALLFFFHLFVIDSFSHPSSS